MKSSTDIILKTQAYALIGETLPLVLCAGALPIGWRPDLLRPAEKRIVG